MRRFCVREVRRRSGCGGHVWCVVTSGRIVVHRSRRLLAGNFGAARWVLIRAVHRFYVKYANAMGAGVMFWWVVTSGRSVVQRSRRLFCRQFWCGASRPDPGVESVVREVRRLGGCGGHV